MDYDSVERILRAIQSNPANGLPNSIALAADAIAALRAENARLRLRLEKAVNKAFAGKQVPDQLDIGSTIVVDRPVDEIEQIIRAALEASHEA